MKTKQTRSGRVVIRGFESIALALDMTPRTLKCKLEDDAALSAIVKQDKQGTWCVLVADVERYIRAMK